MAVKDKLGGISGSRPAGQAPSGLVASRFDPGRIQQARESWARILNMDGGQPQATAAAMWASLYADTLLNALETTT